MSTVPGPFKASLRSQASQTDSAEEAAYPQTTDQKAGAAAYRALHSSITGTVEPIRDQYSITGTVEPLRDQYSITGTVEPLRDQYSITGTVEPVRDQYSITGTVTSNGADTQTPFLLKQVSAEVVLTGRLLEEGQSYRSTTPENMEITVEEDDDCDFTVVEELPPPSSVLNMYMLLASGEAVALGAGSDQAAIRMDAALSHMARLLLPGESLSSLNFAKDLILSFKAGKEQPPRSLRALVTEKEKEAVSRGEEPGAILRAVEECAQAIERASGVITRFSLSPRPVADQDRVSLRRPETIQENSVLSRLPQLPSLATLLASPEEAHRTCYQESFNEALRVAQSLGLSTELINQGARRIGKVESILFAVLAQMSAGIKEKKEKLTQLRSTLTDQDAVVEEIKTRERQIETLTALIRKMNVDRFALYLGILFKPDARSSDTFATRVAQADKEAEKLQKRLTQELGVQMEQLRGDLEQKRPSRISKVWAHFSGKPLQEMHPIPDREYAAKVGSLVYAHLQEVEAHLACSDFLTRHGLSASFPALEAGCVALSDEDVLEPRQFNELMEECAHALHPTDETKRRDMILSLKEKRRSPTAPSLPAANLYTASEIASFYFPASQTRAQEE